LQQTKFEGLALSLEDQLMVRLCEALLIFAQGDYVGCVERLGRVRHIADRCGGSLAQCDLIQLTIVEAALRANKANLARSLVAERMAHKPSSRLNRRLYQRLGDKPQDGVSRHTRVKPLPLICTNSGPSNE